MQTNMALLFLQGVKTVFDEGISDTDVIDFVCSNLALFSIM